MASGPCLRHCEAAEVGVHEPWGVLAGPVLRAGSGYVAHLRAAGRATRSDDQTNSIAEGMRNLDPALVAWACAQVEGHGDDATGRLLRAEYRFHLRDELWTDARARYLGLLA